MVDRWMEWVNRWDVDELQALKRQEELGELNFASVVDKLELVRRWIAAVGQEPIEELPSPIVNEVDQRLKQIDTVLETMKAFSLTQDQAASQRQSIESQIVSQKEWFAQNVRPHIRGAVVDVAETRGQLDALLKEANEAADEVQGLVASLRQTAGESGADTLSSYYQQQAKRYADQAENFFKVSVALLIITALVGAVGLVGIPPDFQDSDLASTIPELVSRLFFVGLSSYALSFAVKTYRTNKHLEVVNLEKRNALNTFPLLTEAAPSEQIRDVVAAELSRFIFSGSESGFIQDAKERTVIENVGGLNGLLRLPQS